jgi:trigger factor
MKKKIVLIFIAALAVSTVLGGCGQKENEASGSLSVSAEAEEDVTITADELLAATDYNVEDYVTLNDYMNMTVELDQAYEVTDEDVQSYVSSLISNYPSYEVSDKTVVESGDVVNIDFVGKKDGEAFDGGSSEGYELEIGSGSFIDGFEDGLIGVNVGDTVDLNLTFPDSYSNEDLAGQDVVFTVTVNSIDTEVEMTYENITDEYVSDNFYTYYGVSTVDELKDYASNYLDSYNQYYEQQEIQTKALEKLVQECEVAIPDGLLESRIADSKETIQANADANDMTLEEYLINATSSEISTEEELEDYLEEQLIQELILEAIVQDQQISITQSEVDTFVSTYMSYYGFESAEDLYENYGGEAYFKLSYAENQAMTLVIDNVTTTVNEDASAESEQELVEE